VETRMIKVRLRIMVEPDDERFHAYCPELKGLHVDGATEEEALGNAKDAANAYLRSLIKHNDPIPLGVLEIDHRASVGRILKELFAAIFQGKSTAHIEELQIAAA